MCNLNKKVNEKRAISNVFSIAFYGTYFSVVACIMQRQ
jgi:hypothetical protein